MAAACGSVEQDGGDATPPPIDAAIDAPEITSCTPNQFVDCDGDSARICNATGDGVMVQSCGSPGCNATAMRCNECVPNTPSCDGMVLESCSADGTFLPDVTCTLGCVAAPSAHCAYLQPVYLPDVCDAPAQEAALTVSSNATLDTGLETTCNGGIVAQTGGPGICVIRYGTISVSSGRTLTVTGTRAAAFVSDGPLQIAGVLDGAAQGVTSGPGGGTIQSGMLASGTTGAGGAGFLTAGASGGSTTATGGAMNAGAALDPLAGSVLIGGPRAARPSIALGVSGGGGGGAVTLISCRGTVTVSGTIDVGGGGGQGGIDLFADTRVDLRGGGGGGAGGYVVIQGLAVNVTGNLFANGGGGGGGAANDTPGGAGGDGTRSTSSSATGGTPASGGGNGGTGGRVGASPGGGGASASSPGGGGGSAGRFQVYTPTGVNPILMPAAISPPFASNRTVPTR